MLRMTMKKILIIGGGAAGLMTAATLAERGVKADITLVERNPRLGQKVIISGGGRCNVTTGHEDLKKILEAYPRGARFLRTAMHAFTPMAMRDWVEAHGVPLKREEDFRIFPRSNKGTDVVRIFEKILERSKVNILCRASVTQLTHSDQFLVELNTGEVLKSDILVITTGGQAYRHTGSQGDGYNFAEALGHHITPLAPSLSAFTLEDKWVKSLAGVSFPQVKIRLIGHEKHEFTGPLLFTHKGITGPGVFALSALAAFETLPAEVELDFFPEQNHEILGATLKQHLGGSPQKQFHNTLGALLPNSFADAFCAHLEIPPHKRNNELSKKDINRAIQTLKQLKLKAVGRSPGDEFVTAGGVDLSEVDPKTMQSKLQPGLYFAGEILDIDGFTGGYNLQASWAAGRLVGESIDRE